MTKSYYRQIAKPRPIPSPVSDGLAIPGPLLRKLVTIHSHYEGRGERIGGVAAPHVDTVLFEATVTDGARTFHVKLRMSDSGVEEYGREEDISI
jgi:hypothetical protein